jgi:hypothetical protein
MKYTNQHIQQQIEAYLRQEMTDLERSGFERRMHEDPELHEEVKEQEALISAVRQERMLELKSGLQGVGISLWSASMMEMAKVAIIAAGIGLAGLGAYIYYPQHNSSGESTQATSQIKPGMEQEILVDATTNFNEKSEATSSISSTASVENEPKVPEPAPKTSYQKSEQGNSGHAVAAGEAATSSEQELKEPEFKNTQPSTPSDIALPEDGISNKTLPESMQPEVVIKRDNRDKFHYQFAEGKLVLYADFNEKLYEVLELNQYGQRQLYLAYDGRFFFLNPSASGISPLMEVKDKNLNQILQTYQKRK